MKGVFKPFISLIIIGVIIIFFIDKVKDTIKRREKEYVVVEVINKFEVEDFTYYLVTQEHKEIKDLDKIYEEQRYFLETLYKGKNVWIQVSPRTYLNTDIGDEIKVFEL